MSDPEEPLRALHARYCDITKRTDRYEPYRWEWTAFSRNYTEQDLVDTLAYILTVNKNRSRGMEIQTSVRKLICDLQEFERHRADMDQKKRELAARKRAWVPSDGEKALGEFRKTEPQPPERGPAVARDVLLKNLTDLKSKLERE